MKALGQLLNNPVLTATISSWLIAQMLKLIFTFILTRKVVPERLFGPGGMPSAHAALVCSLMVMMARVSGFGSPMFALALVLAVVVMYDAVTVRRQAGIHAKRLNEIAERHAEEDSGTDPAADATNDLGADPDEGELLSDEGMRQDKGDEEENELKELKALKELLGHTPMEVLAGALLGTLVAILIPIL